VGWRASEGLGQRGRLSGRPGPRVPLLHLAEDLRLAGELAGRHGRAAVAPQARRVLRRDDRPGRAARHPDVGLQAAPRRRRFQLGRVGAEGLGRAGGRAGGRGHGRPARRLDGPGEPARHVSDCALEFLLCHNACCSCCCFLLL